MCQCGTLDRMSTQPIQVGTLSKGEAIDRIVELLAADDGESVNTSMRIPVALREAAAIAVDELGLAVSTTSLTFAALREELSAEVARAALELHYEQHPEFRPTLADLAVAGAELDGHPLAKEPDVLRRAAAQIVTIRPDADADDVIIWAEAQRAAAG